MTSGEYMNTDSNYLVIGKITTAFGIKGWVKIVSFTENPIDIFSYSPWFLKQKGNFEEVDVQLWKQQSKGLVVKFPNCNDRDKAFSLRQIEIAVKVEQIKTLEDGDFYWRDLVGCRVINADNENLGVVKKLMETGANDVLVVNIDNDAVSLKSSKGELLKERLIPYVPEVVVTNVDINLKLINVDWPSDF